MRLVFMRGLTGRELSDTRAWVSRTKWAIPQAGVAAKPCRSNEGSTALAPENPKWAQLAPRSSARSADEHSRSAAHRLRCVRCNDGLERMLSKARAIWINSVLVSSRWIVPLLVRKLVEQQPVYAYYVALRYPTLPDAREGLVKLLLRPARHHFVDEGNILAGGKDKRKFFLSRREDVVS